MSELLKLFDMTARQAHTMALEQSVAGDPIVIGGVTLIPVSKISCGFSSGGSEQGQKKNPGGMTAGAGAKITKTPLIFLAVWEDQVEVLNVNQEEAKKKGLTAALKPLVQSFKEKAAAKKAEKAAAKAEEKAKKALEET